MVCVRKATCDVAPGTQTAIKLSVPNSCCRDRQGLRPEGDPRVLGHAPGKTTDLFLEEPDEIAAYQDTASRLLRSALGADDSVALIEQMLREMT